MTEAPKGLTLLALDCSGAACSVAGLAVASDCRDYASSRLLSQRQEILQRGHAERIVPLLSDCLVDANMPATGLDAVVVTVGPGAFTGLRVGLAAAIGLARAASCPSIGVGVCEAVAASVPARAGAMLVVAIDSRRADPFCALFHPVERSGGELSWQGTAPEPVAPNARALGAFLKHRKDEALIIAGDAAEQISPDLPEAEVLTGTAYCDVGRVAWLGACALREGTARPARPLYLRAPDVSKPARDRFRVTVGE